MKVNKDTIGRTIVLAIALLNQVLAIFGKGTFDFAEEQIYQIVTLLFTFGASITAWWKNNSFSKSAIVGDKLKQAIREDGIEGVTGTLAELGIEGVVDDVK